MAAGRDHTDERPRGLPGDLVARVDPVSFCDRFGDGDLKLAGDFGHDFHLGGFHLGVLELAVLAEASLL